MKPVHARPVKTGYPKRRLRRCKAPGALLALSVVGAAPAMGAVPVIVGDTSNLLPNQANQPIHFLITGSDSIGGEEVDAQINDGTVGPTINSLDILAGTIFALNNLGQFNLSPGAYAGRLAIASTYTSAGTVVDNGTLATLYVSTVGMSSGTFQINLLATHNGNTTLFDAVGNPLNPGPAYPNIMFSINAPNRVWIHSTGDTWGTDANWTPFAPYTIGDPANFLSAVPSGTATVTLDGSRVAGSVTFNNSAASYVIAPGTGGTLQLNNGASVPFITDAGGNHSITAPVAFSAGATVTVANPGDTLTLAGNLSGGAITFAGSGIVVLGGNNSYAGPTNINGSSTVSIVANNALGAAGAPISFGGGTLQTADTITLGVGLPRNITLGASGGTFSLPGANTVTVSGVISGAGNLTVTGSGSTLLVTGAANYSGLTTVGTGSTIEFGGGVTHTTGMLDGGSGTFTVDAGTILDSGLPTSSTVGTLNVNGVHNIAVNASLNNRTGRVSVLNIGGSGPSAWTGKLDLANNNLIVGSATNTTSFANIRQQIAQAAGTPAPANPWNGTGGITSSSAASASAGATKTGLGYATGAEYTGLTGFTLFDSLTFNSTDTLVKYTLVGDANLDGSVNINDFFALSGHITLPGDWSQGDFNYTGTVDINDFFAMTGNFGKTLAVGSLLPAAAAARAVPEPACLAILALGGLAVSCRRRSRRVRTVR